MKKAYILAAISIFFWSTVATVTKLLMGSLSSMQVLCISVFFAGLFWLAVNIVTGNIKKLKEYRSSDWLKALLIGLPGTFLYYLLFYTGTDLMLASQAFIINYLWPIMSVVFACIILKEKVTVRKCIAIGSPFWAWSSSPAAIWRILAAKPCWARVAVYWRRCPTVCLPR